MNVGAILMIVVCAVVALLVGVAIGICSVGRKIGPLMLIRPKRVGRVGRYLMIELDKKIKEADVDEKAAVASG